MSKQEDATTTVPDEDKPSDEGHAQAEVDVSSLAPEVQQLIEQLAAERDDAVAARQRALADFVNFQRRSGENEIRARQGALASVLRSLLPVFDHIDMALSQDAGQITTAQLMDGIRMVRDELNKAMENNSVKVIDPIPHTEFDPSRHLAVMKEHTERQPANTIVAVLQVGYALGDSILRPASVTVAAPPEA